MDLNICLYCEKPLDNEKLTFCSGTCQLNEATKNHLYINNNTHHSMIRSNSVQSIPSSTLMYYPSLPPSPTTTTTTNYEMAYHRRQSFSYSPVMRRRFSNSTSTSSYNSLSSSSTISFDSKYFLDSS
ncbi:unnamed protein product [Cunninghamella blakesleeana]